MDQFHKGMINWIDSLRMKNKQAIRNNLEADDCLQRSLKSNPRQRVLWWCPPRKGNKKNARRKKLGKRMDT